MPVDVVRIFGERNRPPGYYDNVLRRGRLRDGRIELSEWQYFLLRLKYSRPGLGDLVALVAQPVARMLDFSLGTKLAGCQACSKRRQKLNNIRWPFGKLALRLKSFVGRFVSWTIKP